MIAFIKRTMANPQVPTWHARFLAMLPAIRRTAQISFRKIRPELRNELTQEVIANCLVAYARLVKLGKEDLAFPSALARFAIAQTRVGPPRRKQSQDPRYHVELRAASKGV